MLIDGMEFCCIPPGPFFMGSDRSTDNKSHGDEQPEHQITLPLYFISLYPVTEAQFKEFVNTSEYEMQYNDYIRGSNDHPVVNVTWHDAIAFCKWMTDHWNSELPKGYAFVLPSETEWEKAARGGIEVLETPVIQSLADRLKMPEVARQAPNTEPQRKYPWKGEFDEGNANTSHHDFGSTTSVDRFHSGASPYGVRDLSGNIWEWTRSLWGQHPFRPSFKYPYNPADGREEIGASDNERRVLRGGSFLFDSKYARCSYRSKNTPYDKYRDFGFRIVASSFKL
ncbi:MAG: formylglycine-generating enzyme family protein [Proteobacteria bacterium]|nr:formylglycine-generating enzyme family protein [Pseudomonadota bacterium]